MTVVMAVVVAAVEVGAVLSSQTITIQKLNLCVHLSSGNKLSMAMPSAPLVRYDRMHINANTKPDEFC